MIMIYPSEITKKWPHRPLSEVVDFLDSKRKPITQKDRVPGPYPYYGANGQQDSVADYIFDEPLVLLAEDGGHFGDADKTIAYQVEGKCWVNNHAHVLRPKKDVDIRYICRHLERYDVTPFITGSTRGKLTKTAANNIPIALPPLEEQRRIAAILDKADGVRRKRKEAIRLTEELLKSTFLEMFGDLFSFVKPEIKEHPKGFLKCLLGDQITLQRGFDLAKSQCKEGAIPVISSGGVSAYHSEAKAKGPGVLLGRKGSVGRVHYIESDYWPHDTTLWIREFNENIPIFVYYFFKEFPISNFEESTANPTLNRNRLHPLEVFWPSGETQNKFAEIFVSSMEYQRREKAYLAESENLFNSLLQRAFRGEL
jgi:type I restriction enzyme S subunit